MHNFIIMIIIIELLFGLIRTIQYNTLQEKNIKGMSCKRDNCSVNIIFFDFQVFFDYKIKDY